MFYIGNTWSKELKENEQKRKGKSFSKKIN